MHPHIFRGGLCAIYPRPVLFPPYISSVTVPEWPLLRQIAPRDLTAFDGPAFLSRTQTHTLRTRSVDRIVKFIGPQRAVACGHFANQSGTPLPAKIALALRSPP